MDIEQGILLDGYAQFVSKVERKPELTGEDAKKWLMGDLMETGFQVIFLLTCSCVLTGLQAAVECAELCVVFQAVGQ